MREIKLTQGKVAFVDDEDFEELNKFKWYAHKHRNTYYALRGFPIRFTMHRELIFVPQGLITDHIDGNGLNNQKSNLRAVTNRVNGQNLHIKKTSQFPGVYWDKTKQKWKSRIKIKGVLKYIGDFKNEEEAATAYRVTVEVLT